VSHDRGRDKGPRKHRSVLLWRQIAGGSIALYSLVEVDYTLGI
jgi:hypothetical protein